MFDKEEREFFDGKGAAATKSGMKNFLNKIPHVLLTAEEEKTLAVAIRLGAAENATEFEKNDAAKAREKLITHNLKLVIYAAKNYEGYGVPLEDLIQEGIIGLMTAVEKFDPTRGFRFSTAAFPWIKQTILRFLSERRKIIRYPSHVAESLRKINKIKAELAQKLEREPTFEEISELMEDKYTPDKIESLIYLTQPIVSTNAIVGEEEDTELGDLIADENTLTPAQYVEMTDAQIRLKKLLECLDNKQKEIITLRYGLDTGEERTLEVIGSMMGVTRERVRQLEEEALKRMRLYAEQNRI